MVVTETKDAMFLLILMSFDLRMYTMFLDKHYPEHYAEYKAGKDQQKSDNEVKYQNHFNYKENFSYGFGSPKTEICTV